MKYAILLFTIVLFGSCRQTPSLDGAKNGIDSAQAIVDTCQEVPESVYCPTLMQEPMPEFDGSFSKYILDNITYQEDDWDGRVVVNFVVDADGNVKKVRLEEGEHSALGTEVLRVVRNSPKWNPVPGIKRPYEWNFRIPIRSSPAN